MVHLARQREQGHDAPRQHDARQYGSHRGLQRHAEQRGDEGTRPSAGAGCWYADEEGEGKGARLPRGERGQLALCSLEQRCRRLHGLGGLQGRRVAAAVWRCGGVCGVVEGSVAVSRELAVWQEVREVRAVLLGRLTFLIASERRARRVGRMGSMLPATQITKVVSGDRPSQLPTWHDSKLATVCDEAGGPTRGGSGPGSGSGPGQGQGHGQGQGRGQRGAPARRRAARLQAPLR